MKHILGVVRKFVLYVIAVSGIKPVWNMLANLKQKVFLIICWLINKSFWKFASVAVMRPFMLL